MNNPAPRMTQAEANRFVEFWWLAKSITEFLLAMEWPIDKATRAKASAIASFFTKRGVPMKRYRGDGEEYIDFAVLQILGEKGMAALGRRKDDAEKAVADLKVLLKEAQTHVLELRKLKHRAVAVEALIAEGELTR